MRKRLSVSEVSDMLFEFYKTKSAKAPKQQQQQDQAELSKYGQISPTSAETLEPSSIAAIALYGAASETASKNLSADEMMLKPIHQLGAAAAASFHPRSKNTNKIAAVSNLPADMAPMGCSAIPTSVLVANTAAVPQKLKSLPTVAATTAALIQKPQSAAIAEALMRNGLHSFQQQLRAQEILRHHQTPRRHANTAAEEVNTANSNEITPTKILENLLRKQQERDMRYSESENDTALSPEDEDDSRYHAFEDIHLMEQVSQKFGQNSTAKFEANSSMYEAQAQALRNLEITLSEYGGSSSNGSITSPNGVGLDGEPVYECRHCGKKYRWKSTLRRHENVECGGKEPSHQCPYCPYKSKQRGNLGVHVRKHHTELPQLPSKRRSKYSIKMEGDMSVGMSGFASDDSQGKLIIDFKQDSLG